MMTVRFLLVGMCIGLLGAGSHGEEVKVPLESSVDLATIREKIAGLGIRDDTVPSNERPERWLKKHRDKALGELISGLDSSELRIAAGCLKLLDGVTGSDELIESLVRIAGDTNHSINAKATLRLCAFADDARAKDILNKAVDDKERFGDQWDRATIAVAIGDKPKAVKLLIEKIESAKRNYEIARSFKRIGELGHKSAIPFLEKLSKGSRWTVAVESYFALAKIDSDKYGLTEDQATFLKDSRRLYSATQIDRIRYWKKRTELDKDQIRPFVKQMPEVVALQIWRDTESIPKIRRLMQTAARSKCRPFIAAYLNLEGTDKSIDEVVELVNNSRYNLKEAAVRSVCQSIMSNERKLEVLRRFRNEFGSDVVAEYFSTDREELDYFLPVLMSEETDIMALGRYAKWAGWDSEKRFSSEVYNALKKLASQERIPKKQRYGAKYIFEACAAYNLDGTGKLTDRFFSDQNSIEFRFAAARVSATLGGDRKSALEFLYTELGNSELWLRKLASETIAGIKCLNKAERDQREQVILSHLGKVSEDCAICLLLTCSGQKSQNKLTEMLDGNDAGRAVYAAWMLSQCADEKIKTRAIRRIAIYAIFNHIQHCQSSSISFGISPCVGFNQVTGWLNPLPADYKPKIEPVVIPNDLLAPFTLNESEQAFSILAYRHARLGSRQVRFPQKHGFGYGWHCQKSGWDASHLPLLKTVAAEDPHLSVLSVKGKEIAHFEYRKNAATIIAAITDKKAAYKGLDGRDIDSENVPQIPYKNQSKLMAVFLLDLFMSSGTTKRPESDLEWMDINNFNTMIYDLVHSNRYALRDELKAELLAESRKRKIAMKLKDSGFSLWRNIE